MTDEVKASPEALAAADAICKKHGMLPGGYMRDSLAEALGAFAAQETTALKHTLELWNKECNSQSPREIVKLLTAAAHALRSYQFGNAAPDLAKNIADQIDAIRPAGTMLGQPISEAERDAISKDGP